MISKREVSYNLRRLEKHFDEAIRRPSGHRDANFYGKLAVLEASAWLEQCIEDIFRKLSESYLTVPQHTNLYNEKIKNNHGFNYEKYFKNTLSLNLIGLVLTERMEMNLAIDPKFSKMKAALSSLTILRGNLAHSHLIGGAMLRVQSVTDTIRLFNDASEGLGTVEKYLKKIKFK